MTDFDSLREDIAGIFDSVVRHSEAQNRLHDAVLVQVDRLWADNAELRDELHALANRVEALTRARLTEPAEVAERIMDRRQT